MTTMRTYLLFFAGLGAGALLSAGLFLALPRAVAAPAAQTGFTDIPIGHFAAASVASLNAKGILPKDGSGKYRGNQPVTRYEAAVMLARFAQYYEQAHAPLSASAPRIPVAPGSPVIRWANDPAKYLVANGFAPPKSPLFLPPPTASVTADQFADAISVMVDHLSSRSLPPPAN